MRRNSQVSGEPFPVAEEVSFNPAISYTGVSVSDNGAMVVLSGGLTNRQLTWFDRAGKQLGTLGPSGNYNDIVLSHDGKRLALQRIADGNSDIWLIDIERGVPSRFTFETSSEDNPVWSPAGDLIVFSFGDKYLRFLSQGLKRRRKQKLIIQVATSLRKPQTRRAMDDPSSSPHTPPPPVRILWILPIGGDTKPCPDSADRVCGRGSVFFS